MSHVRPFAALLALAVLVGCEPMEREAPPPASEASAPQASACTTVTDIEGAYRCTGVCAAADGRLQGPFSETDTIRALGDSLGALYTVRIVGGGGFRETEIGALAGTTLRTATAAVSDSTFPVIEEYVFQAGPGCRAVGFTKIVRGLAAGAFKACAVECRKG